MQSFKPQATSFKPVGAVGYRESADEIAKFAQSDLLLVA